MRMTKWAVVINAPEGYTYTEECDDFEQVSFEVMKDRTFNYIRAIIPIYSKCTVIEDE